MKILRDYDNFFLPADNLDTAKEFYKTKLGLEIKFDFADKGMVAFTVGEREPAIILRKGENLQPSIWFEVDDVKDSYEKLKKKGIVFLSEPFEIMTGLSVEFKDPFGNKFGITDYSRKPKLKGK